MSIGAGQVHRINDAQSLVGMLEHAHGLEVSGSRLGSSNRNFANDFFAKLAQFSDGLDDVILSHSSELSRQMDMQIVFLQEHGLGVYAVLRTHRHKGVGGSKPFEVTTVKVSLKKQ